MATVALEQGHSAGEKQRASVVSTMSTHSYYATLASQYFGANQYNTDIYGLDAWYTKRITTIMPIVQCIYHGSSGDNPWTISGQTSAFDALSACTYTLAEWDRPVGPINDRLITSVFTDHALGVATFAALPVAAPKPERSRAPKVLQDITEQLQTELGRLTDGWDGDGGRAPTSATLQGVAKLLSVLPHNAPVPDAEVDGSDGSVSLRWYSNSGDSVFSMTVSDRRITAISTSRSTSQAWEAEVENASRLARVAADHIERA